MSNQGALSSEKRATSLFEKGILLLTPTPTPQIGCIYRTQKASRIVPDDINEGIQQGKYEMTVDATHEDLEKFQSFLYHNFNSNPRYNDMRPISICNLHDFLRQLKPINLMNTL